jgi:hypothetical protein
MVIVKAKELDSTFELEEDGADSWYRRFRQRNKFSIRRVTKSNLPERFKNVDELIKECQKFIKYFDEVITES